MTEDSNPDGARQWIWVTNWDKFQGRRDRAGLPWFRVYSDLAGNDDWLELRPVDRALLIGIWLDINRWGNGRVSANLRSLRSRHNVTRASLEPLIQAGFIEVSTTKGAPTGHQLGAPEERRGAKAPKEEIENARAVPAENGGPPRENETAPLGDDGLPVMPYADWVALNAERATKEMP